MVISFDSLRMYLQLSLYRLSFKCRAMYHAPTDCPTVRRWLTKCADDSETANYISAHTKDVRQAAHNEIRCGFPIFSFAFVRNVECLSFFSPQCPKCNICIEKNGGCNHMVSEDGIQHYLKVMPTMGTLTFVLVFSKSLALLKEFQTIHVLYIVSI